MSKSSKKKQKKQNKLMDFQSNPSPDSSESVQRSGLFESAEDNSSGIEAKFDNFAARRAKMTSPASSSPSMPCDFSDVTTSQEHQHEIQTKQAFINHIKALTKFYENEIEHLRNSSWLEKNKMEREAKESVKKIREQFQKQEKELNDSHDEEVTDLRRRIVELETEKRIRETILLFVISFVFFYFS
ncbi:hypothetical protein DMENIID0001_014190 [Sergentomyia squamirostris]